MQNNKSTIKLGDLIAALYEEISKITPNKRLQTKLVYLALIDMQVSSPVSKTESLFPAAAIV